MYVHHLCDPWPAVLLGDKSGTFEAQDGGVEVLKVDDAASALRLRIKRSVLLGV